MAATIKEFERQQRATLVQIRDEFRRLSIQYPPLHHERFVSPRLDVSKAGCQHVRRTTWTPCATGCSTPLQMYPDAPGGHQDAFESAEPNGPPGRSCRIQGRSRGQEGGEVSEAAIELSAGILIAASGAVSVRRMPPVNNRAGIGIRSAPPFPWFITPTVFPQTASRFGVGCACGVFAWRVMPAFVVERYVTKGFREQFPSRSNLFHPHSHCLGISSHRLGSLSSPNALPLKPLPRGGFIFLPEDNYNKGDEHDTQIPGIRHRNGQDRRGHHRLALVPPSRHRLRSDPSRRLRRADPLARRTG